MLHATLRINSADADAILKSLKPETGRELPRTRVRVSGEGEETVIEIEADDTSAMRAALNSYLGCIKVTEDIGKMVKVKR